MKGFLERYKYHFFIAVVAIVGYWQVAFFRHTLKWDEIDYFFPWRYFISECLRNGVMPFWNPYQHWGYAMHADPQSGVWYPVVWVISLLHGYDVYALQFEFMLHIVLAGIGMFLLTNRFVDDRRVSFLVGCSYMMSGFFIGNAQHLSYVISGAWIPFVLYYYSKIASPPNPSRPHPPFGHLLQRRREVEGNLSERGVEYGAAGLRNTILCALCFFMMTTGGYPAFTIIVAYIMAIIFLLKIVKLYREKDFKAVKSFFLFNALLFVLSVLLCSGSLLSEIISQYYINRSSKLPLAIAYSNPFSPQSLISCILPLASGKNRQLFGTDISMSNLYFGIVMLAVFVLALFRKKSKFEKIILWTGLFFLLAAFGKYTPVRAILYYVVPLMNLFRFPSIFRLFALICFLLVAAFSLKELLSSDSYRKKLKWIIGIFSGVYFVLFIVYLFKGSVNFKGIIYFNHFINSLTFNQSIFIQSLLALIVLAGLWVWLRKKGSHTVFAFIALFDLFIAAQLSTPVTVVYETKTSAINNYLKVIPKNTFPVPANVAALNYCDTSVHLGSLWRNMSIWQKQPGYDGLNSFKMKGYYQLDDEPQVMQPLLKNNLAFFSNSSSFYKDTIRDAELLKQDPTHLFFREGDRSKIAKANLISDSTAKAIFERFDPGHITVSTSSASPQFLTLMQHDYPLWKVLLDGNEIEHFTSDYLFMTIALPGGNHSVEYKFENTILIRAAVISIVVLLLCIAFITIKSFSKLSPEIPIQRGIFAKE